jgi:hypothetical protein
MHGVASVALVSEQMGHKPILTAQLINGSAFDKLRCLIELANAILLLPIEVKRLIKDRLCHGNVPP